MRRPQPGNMDSRKIRTYPPIIVSLIACLLYTSSRALGGKRTPCGCLQLPGAGRIPFPAPAGKGAGCSRGFLHRGPAPRPVSYTHLLVPHFLDAAHIFKSRFTGAAEGGREQILLGFVFVERLIDLDVYKRQK